MAGNYVQSFFGSTEAAKWLVENGLAKSLSSHSHITNCCNKKKKSCLWLYMEVCCITITKKYINFKYSSIIT